MKLSVKGQYAVMALADIAKHGKEQPVSLNEISARQNLPLQYLEQLFSKLRRKGIVRSSRGNKGGYELFHHPSAIKVLDVIKAVDEKIKSKRCVLDSPLSCQGKLERCLTHKLWEGLEIQIESYLNSVSLFDLCNGTLPTLKEPSSWA